MSKAQSLRTESALSLKGLSILEKYEAALDTIIDELMEAGDSAGDRMKGRADGIVQCIAIMRNPYQPNETFVRDDAMERYDERNL